MSGENLSDEPEPTVSDSRQTKILRGPDGKLLPGTAGLPGGGRPKGSGPRKAMPPLYQLVEQMAADNGITAAEATKEVVATLYKAAVEGDTKAAMYIASRCPDFALPTAPPSERMAITFDSDDVDTSNGPPIPVDDQAYAAEAEAVIEELKAMGERHSKLDRLLK